MKIFVGAGNRREMDPARLRVPVPEYLEIVVEDFVGFIEKFASNISKGGVFIATDKALAEGSAMAVLFRLEDDYTLIRGQGTVVWVRHEDLGPRREAGMGVRFDWLDDQSQKLINKIVSTYIREGGKPFRLENQPGGTGAHETLPDPQVEVSLPVTTPADKGELASLLPPPEAPLPEAPPLEVPPPEAPLPEAPLPEAPPLEVPPLEVPPPEVAVAPAVAFVPEPDLVPETEESVDDLQGINSISANRQLAPGLEGQSRAEPRAEPAEDPLRAPPVSLSNTGTLRAAEPSAAQPQDAVSTAPPGISLSGTGTFSTVSSVDPRSVDPNLVQGPPILAAADPQPSEVIHAEALGALPEPGLAPGGAATSPENAPLDELADPGGAYDEPSLAAFEQDGSFLADGSLLGDTSLDSALSETGGFEEEFMSAADHTAGFPESAPPAKEFSESDFDGLDFAMLVKKANEQQAEVDSAGLERPASLDTDFGTGTNHGAIDVPDMATPTPFSDLSAGDSVDDVEYSIDLGSTDEISVPVEAPVRLTPTEPVPVKPPVPKPSSLVYTNTQPMDVGSIDIRSTGPIPIPMGEDESTFLKTGGYTSIPTPEERRRTSGNGGASKAIVGVMLMALGVALYVGGKYAIEEVTAGAPVKVGEVLLDETNLVLEDPSSATLLRLMQGQVSGPVVLREDDRPMQKLTRVQNITWLENNKDTVLIIWADGGFTPTSTAYLHLDDPQREVVKLLGAEAPFEPSVIEIDSPHLTRVRLGFHVGRGYNEIHIVADVANDKVLLKRFELRGDQLHIRFGR